MRSPLVLLSALALTGPPAAAQTALWVVDDDGGAGVDFSALQAAVDAAQDGDALLVRAGDYERVAIDGKSLTVIGEAGAVVRALATSAPFEPAVTIANLPATGSVVWRGVDVENGTPGFPIFFQDGAALHLVDNAGVVWIEDALFAGGTKPACARVENCATVHFRSCELRGRSAPFFLPNLNPGAGLAVVDSHVFLFDSQLFGATGTGDDDPFACEGYEDGAPGAFVDGGLLGCYGSALHGGDGGDGVAIDICYGGGGSDGGPGLELRSASSRAEAQDTSFVPGGGGAGICGNCPGVAGVPVELGPGSLTALAGSARSVSLAAPVREGELASLALAGEAGDLVFLGFGSHPIGLTLAGFAAPLAVAPPVQVVFLAALPPAGELDLSFSVGMLGPAADFGTLFVQTASVTASLEVFLGAPTAWVVVDQGF